MQTNLPQVHAIPLAQGDAGTEATIQQMYRLIDEGLKDPLVNRTAAAIVRSAPQFNRMAEAQAVYRWVRNPANLRFTSDPRGKELLRAPRETLSTRAGDCDDYVILICALLGTIGHKMRIVTVASHPIDRESFTHVYPEDWIRGRWVALDAARRRPAIGKTPSYFSRKRAWYADGSYEDFSSMRGAPAGGVPWVLQIINEAQSRTKPANLAGLGDDGDFSFAQLPADITAATAGAANIIRATNAPSIPYLPPGYAIGPGGVPIATSAYAAPTNLSSYTPLLLIGGLLLAVMAMKN